MKNKSIIISGNDSVYENLAYEEYLFENLKPQQQILFLYRNKPAVVIGKNQNPWKEVNLPELHKQSVNLARRISGGGTVYHDEGNLNYTFFVDTSHYNQQHNFQIVLDTLKELNVDARIENTSDIFVNKYKVSGNSFCIRKDRVLHHGTLLLNVNLSALNSIIVVNDFNISNHAAQSHRLNVRNLADFNADITMNLLMEILAEKFLNGDEAELKLIDSYFDQPIEKYIKKQKDISWIYERTPNSTMEKDNHNSVVNSRIGLHSQIAKVQAIGQ